MPPLQVHLALAVMLAVDFCCSLHGASVSFSCILCAFDCVRVQVRACSSVRVPEYNFVFVSIIIIVVVVVIIMIV